MSDILIKNAQLVNEGKIISADLLIRKDRIERVDPSIDVKFRTLEIDAAHQFVCPGIIDDQVHFREPGLTHKASIETESRAAIAGGVTSFMEMPNTQPATLTEQLLEEKYSLAAQTSYANYSFFMGVSNDNLKDVLEVASSKKNTICGLKIFMGSSTGNMLVDNTSILERVFAESNLLIATHCEDETIIREATKHYKESVGNKADASFHPIVRAAEACYKSSSLAVSLAKKYDTRLHILHISTADEIALFDNKIPLKNKRITAEACVHHLYFNDQDYETQGNKIKCNPAIKSKLHQDAILQGVLENYIDIIATDHAPHTWEEKSNAYWEAPSGVPLVQHSFQMMLALYHEEKITLEKIIEKMCHAPADCFLVKDRGFLREGYFADLFFADLEKQFLVTKENILYKCNWSPFENKSFRGCVTKTILNGEIVFENGVVYPQKFGQRLLFARD